MAARKFDDSTELAISVQYELYEMSAPTLARKFNTTSSTIYYILRKYGVEIRSQSREGNPAWKGGRQITSNGYVAVKCPDRFADMKTARGMVLEHRLTMAQVLGRSLTEFEEVHHINGDKKDNRVENLQLRIGKHGTGMVYQCGECGSDRLMPTPLKTAAMR